ncbi:TetR/AcrR family transcriptional regulator [Azohydromonas sediminis]|uniref:TetR/AcrR family transcriptional regulator n=1 Tax=Azohydromonas sediminis TaxID=2259674 RepID=UPI000E652B16|nr:TetR/AcrR family transcriptional regulator [Azohydromonas sediminis]
MRAPVPATARPRRAAARAAAPERRDRRADILLAAERLFAERGYHAVTIRQIAQAAGVPLALVGYYFGAKHELFRALFEHWKGTIDERMAGLRAAVDAGGPELLERIVDAFVTPVLRLRASAEGEFYALLVARELQYRTPGVDSVLSEYFDPMAHAFIDALQRAAPHATRAQVAWGYQFALGALLHHLSDRRVGELSRRQARPNDPSAAPLLAAFITAGLKAVLAAPPAAAPTSTTPTRRRP